MSSMSFGISVQGWGPWLVDQGKTLGLSLFLSAPLMLLMHWIMRRSPRRYWIWAWLLPCRSWSSAYSSSR